MFFYGVSSSFGAINLRDWWIFHSNQKTEADTTAADSFLVEKCFGFKVIDIIHDKKSFEHFRAVIITVDAIEQSKLACAQKSRCAKQGDWTKDFVYEKWSNHQELNNTNP